MRRRILNHTQLQKNMSMGKCKRRRRRWHCTFITISLIIRYLLNHSIVVTYCDAWIFNNFWQNNVTKQRNIYFWYCPRIRDFYLFFFTSISRLKKERNKWSVPKKPNRSPPDFGSDGVLLNPPCCRVVDGLPVDLQPLTHLPQALLKDGRDPSVVRRPDVHQQVSPAGHCLHQRLKRRVGFLSN